MNAAIQVGLELAKTRGKIHSSARLVFLLPTSYFAKTTLNQRYYQHADFVIEHEYAVGRWSYVPGKPEKQNSDSVFILKHREGKEIKLTHPFSYVSVDDI